MFIEWKLKKQGIEEIEPLDKNTIIKIVTEVANKIASAFPNANLSYIELYYLLINTPMYYAKMPDELSKVNYFYQNSSIYISKNVKINEIKEEILHECIHRIQEHRDKKGTLTRFGICEINEVTVTNMALNEAAVQYIVEKALKKQEKIVNVYGIDICTKTEYYPLITNLINQIIFLLGEEKLIDSTLNSNEEFKYEIMDNIGEHTYSVIKNNFDSILNTKNQIVEQTQKGQEKIEELVKQIQDLYFQTQNEIYTSYFNKLFKKLEKQSEVEEYKNKLNKYQRIIGKAEWNKDFENYYIEQNIKIEEKSKEIQRKTSLSVVNDNLFSRIIRKIKKLFTNSKTEYNK